MFFLNRPEIFIFNNLIFKILLISLTDCQQTKKNLTMKKLLKILINKKNILFIIKTNDFPYKYFIIFY